MMVNYSKQNVLAEPRTEGLSGGLSDVRWRPRLAVAADLWGPNGRTFDLALIWKAPECRRQEPYPTSFRILVGIYCHNIPTHTPQSGYHGVTEVAKTANIAKMAEKCRNCMSARPTLPLCPIQTPWSWDLETLFRLKIQKDKTFLIFDPKKGASFFRHLDPPPPPTLPQNLKKVGFKWGGSGPKTHRGMCLLDQMMFLQGVRLTI